MLTMTKDVVCFSAIISCCQKAGQWQPALTLVDAMLQRNLAPNLVTFNAAISSCEQQGMWQQTLRFMELMEDVSLQPDVILGGYWKTFIFPYMWECHHPN